MFQNLEAHRGLQAVADVKKVTDKLGSSVTPEMDELQDNLAVLQKSMTAAQVLFVEIGLVFALTHLTDPASTKSQKTMKNILREQLGSVDKHANGIEESLIESRILSAARQHKQ